MADIYDARHFIDQTYCVPEDSVLTTEQNVFLDIIWDILPSESLGSEIAAALGDRIFSLDPQFSPYINKFILSLAGYFWVDRVNTTFQGTPVCGSGAAGVVSWADPGPFACVGRAHHNIAVVWSRVIKGPFGQSQNIRIGRLQTFTELEEGCGPAVAAALAGVSADKRSAIIAGRAGSGVMWCSPRVKGMINTLALGEVWLPVPPSFSQLCDALEGIFPEPFVTEFAEVKVGNSESVFASGFGPLAGGSYPGGLLTLDFLPDLE